MANKSKGLGVENSSIGLKLLYAILGYTFRMIQVMQAIFVQIMKVMNNILHANNHFFLFATYTRGVGRTFKRGV